MRALIPLLTTANLNYQIHDCQSAQNYQGTEKEEIHVIKWSSYLISAIKKTPML